MKVLSVLGSSTCGGDVAIQDFHDYPPVATDVSDSVNNIFLMTYTVKFIAKYHSTIRDKIFV